MENNEENFFYSGRTEVSIHKLHEEREKLSNLEKVSLILGFFGRDEGEISKLIVNLEDRNECDKKEQIILSKRQKFINGNYADGSMRLSYTIPFALKTQTSIKQQTLKILKETGYNLKEISEEEFSELSTRHFR